VDDGDWVPSSLARGHDVAASAVPESSEAATAALIEGVADAPSSRYVDFPSIRIIDLDATELPSNDWGILEVTMERMFADPSILDAIASVPPVPRQNEGAGGSAPPTVLEAAKGDLRDPTASMESVVIEPPPMSAGESTNAPLLQPAEAGMDAPTPSVVGVVEGVVEGVGPSSSQPAAATAEEVPMLSQPTAAPQECDAPEGTTRAAPPKSVMPLGARQQPPPLRSRRLWRTQARPYHEAS
jgi:hypothetical protein